MQPKKQKLTKNLSQFAARLKQLREYLNCSQREMSSLMGLTGNTQVSKFENGTSEPSIENLRRLVSAAKMPFPIDLHELITGKLSPVAIGWQDRYSNVLQLAARYISSHTALLLEERHRLWNEAYCEDLKVAKGTGDKEHLSVLKARLSHLNERIADVAKDFHFVTESLESIKETTTIPGP